MSRHLIGSLAVAAGMYVAPLIPVADRLVHPGPWLGLVAAWVMLVSQPPVPREEWLDTQAVDRRSALFIFLSMIGVQLAAVLEFGHGGTLGTGLTRPAESVVIGRTGVSLVAIGLALRLWSIHTLGRWFTATVRVVEGQRVVRSGPYRALRHPSYTGALLVGLGMVMVLESPIGLTLLLAAAIPAYLRRIGIEERSLIAALGPEYERYRMVTWRLIPLVF